MERFNGKILCTIADALLKPLIPDIQQLCAYEMKMPKDHQNPLSLHFLNTLIRGTELVKNYESISPSNLFLRHIYATHIVKLLYEIDGVIRCFPAHLSLDAIHDISVLKNLLEQSGCAIIFFQQPITGYIARLCEEYWDSGPNYLNRRRIYFAAKGVYLDLRRDYLEIKEKSTSTWQPSEPERDFLIYEAKFLSVKKDFMALKQYNQMSFEKDIDRMREFFLGSKRDEFRHDVFLSFRGKDVRGTLADQLSQSLSKAGLRVFLDSKDLKKGAKIWPSLKRAIEKSAICIPIYSEGYAESTWCLKESAAMLEIPHLIIMPLFYGVDPSDVRYPMKKRSPYKRSFEKHYGHPDRHPQGEIDGWKSALEDICSRSGWTVGVTEDRGHSEGCGGHTSISHEISFSITNDIDPSIIKYKVSPG